MPSIAAVAVALVTNACDSSESDRAGGEPAEAERAAGRATTLTLANVNSEPEVLQGFAEKVEALGRDPADPLREQLGAGRRGNAEVNLIRDVKAGKADLGWGSRAFDLVGDRPSGRFTRR